MNPERWKEIDALLQAALRLLADQREEFARKTCSGDMALESKRSQSKWRRERLLGLEIPK